MSKSVGNVVDPWDVLNAYGADAFRWYFFTAKQPWDGYRFDVETIGDSVRLFLNQLWNVYAFHVRYANVTPEPRPGEPTELDRWVRSRLAATVETVRDRLDAFDATNAGRAIAAFVDDDLSNWYVRRSRRRFWEGEAAALDTLRECLLTLTKLLAPFCPFVADEIYDNLDGGEPSVHLCDFPAPGARDLGLEEDMRVARETVQLGLGARGQARIKVRQPLRAAVVVATGAERAAIERLAELVREELNVKELRFAQGADELASVEVKPNYRTLGPRFGRDMPMAARAIAGLDPAHVARALDGGDPVVISVSGHDHTLAPADLLTSMTPLAGYQLEREGQHAVALELALDDELLREGLAREAVHTIQQARKDAGLDVSDRVTVRLSGPEEVLAAVRAHEAFVAGETLAVSVAYEPDGQAPLAVAVERA